MRIASLVPAGTEILCALGLEQEIVGVSHGCRVPAGAAQGPRLTRSAIDPGLSSGAIDDEVREALRRGTPLYAVDDAALRQARPDLVVTQRVCEVCAVGAEAVEPVLAHLVPRPQVLALHTHSIAELLEEILALGRATGRLEQAQRLTRSMRQRIEAVRKRVADAARPRVFCLEWLKPPMASGHWVPEMVEHAGGREVLGHAGEPSRTVTWDAIAAAAPEVLVLMPCGLSVERTRSELSVVEAEPLWARLPAVQRGRVYLVDGPALFNGAGPRLAEGVELLAGLFHPERCGSLIPTGSFGRIR